MIYVADTVRIATAETIVVDGHIIIQYRPIPLAPVIDGDTGALIAHVTADNAGQARTVAHRVAQLLNRHGLVDVPDTVEVPDAMSTQDRQPAPRHDRTVPMITQVRRSPSSPNGSSDTPGRSSSRLRPGAAHPPIIPALAILAGWLIGLALEGGWL